MARLFLVLACVLAPNHSFATDAASCTKLQREWRAALERDRIALEKMIAACTPYHDCSSERSAQASASEQVDAIAKQTMRECPAPKNSK